MTKRDNRHGDRLRPMTAQDMAHLYDVERCFLAVLDMHLREKGVVAELPSDLKTAVELWRTATVRLNRANDYRIKPSEVKATDEVMKWAYKTKMELCGQKPELPV